MNLLMYGLLTGVIIGFLMQRARVIRYDLQVAALRFIDMTILKFMFSAASVGMIGLYILKNTGLAGLNIKTATIGANIIGGLIFGVGWGILGYCPGTQAGAIGEGRWDAIWGILGMLSGAMVFAEIYPFLKKTVMAWSDMGKITLPEALNTDPWFVIPALIFVYFGLSVLFEKKGI